MTIRVHVFDAGGHFGRALPRIRRTIAAAIEHVRASSTLENVDIAVHPADFGSDQFPISAFTTGPHNIHIGIERSQLRSEDLEEELYRSTVHELHHALRWRYLGARWTVGETVVLEGLALLADHAAAGPEDFTDRPLADPARAISHLKNIQGEQVSHHRAWLYSPEEAQPGAAARVYTLGTLLMTATLQEVDLDPWAAAEHPADDLLDKGFSALDILLRHRKKTA
ncbi:MAG: DUF2268 domain-containing putative Zn-dependent protease [Pseudomonadota bacterium]